MVLFFCLLAGWTEFCRMFRNSPRRLDAHPGLQWTQRQNALCGRWRHEQYETNGTFSQRFTHTVEWSFTSFASAIDPISAVILTLGQFQFWPEPYVSIVVGLHLHRPLFRTISSRYWNSWDLIWQFHCIRECYYSKLELDRVFPKNNDLLEIL